MLVAFALAEQVLLLSLVGVVVQQAGQISLLVSSLGLFPVSVGLVVAQSFVALVV